MSLPRLNQFDFHHALAELQGPAIVVFTSPHCASCKAAKQALLKLRDEHPELSMFEVDSHTDEALARELPALFLFKDGEYHAELQAAPQPQAILTRMRHLLTLPAEEAP